MDSSYINTDFLSKRILAQTINKKADPKGNVSDSKSATGSEEEKLKTACQDFEAIFLNFMFQSMKKTLPGDGLFGKSLGKDLYESMYYQELSSDIAKGGKGVGIGEKLYAELKGESVEPSGK